jgi:hypothetical protein
MVQSFAYCGYQQHADRFDRKTVKDYRSSVNFYRAQTPWIASVTSDAGPEPQS